jgi:hypothetical protein
LIEVLNPGHVSGCEIIVQFGPLSEVHAFQLERDGSRSAPPFTFKNGRVFIKAPTELLSMIVVEGSRK